MDKGIRILKELTDFVKEDGGSVITAYIENRVGEWNQKLVEENVTVLEMTRKFPTLEDLFLELTGGDSID